MVKKGSFIKTCCWVLAFGAAMLGAVAGAEELARIDVRGEKLVLLGDKLANGYVHNLLLRAETETVPYVVSGGLSGGYWPNLQVVTLRKGEQQVLLSLRQGGQKATTEYRIFGKAKNKWQPVFDAVQDRGIIRYVVLADRQLQLELINGTKQTIKLKDKIWEKIENAYQHAYQPEYEGMYSLLPWDTDHDGVQELYLTQRIALEGQELGHMAVRLDLQKDDSWKMSRYVFQMPVVSNGEEKINEGITCPAYEIHPVKIYVEKAQGAYPVFYGVSSAVAQKINALWKKTYSSNLQGLFRDQVPMGFEVLLHYENILSVRFIGGTPKLNSFVHVDPGTGEVLTMASMFKINGDFLKTMTILSPSKHRYVMGDLKEWFMKGTKLYIVLQEQGKQRTEQFALSAFEGFVRRDNKILQKKVD